MNPKQAKLLGNQLKQARVEMKLSAREVADRSGMADSNVLRLEQGSIANPRPETLKSLADTLRLDLADLYAAAGYVQPTGLPSFAPYLRSKYADLPPSAQRELERTFRKILREHGYDPAGPTQGQDEN